MIRIAKGPPTCEGNYSYAMEGENKWVSVNVFMWAYREHEELCVMSRDTKGIVAVESFFTHGWIWSTRIPDPIEETDGE